MEQYHILQRILGAHGVVTVLKAKHLLSNQRLPLKNPNALLWKYVKVKGKTQTCWESGKNTGLPSPSTVLQ